NAVGPAGDHRQFAFEPEIQIWHTLRIPIVARSARTRACRVATHLDAMVFGLIAVWLNAACGAANRGCSRLSGGSLEIGHSARVVPAPRNAGLQACKRREQDLQAWRPASQPPFGGSALPAIPCGGLRNSYRLAEA